MPGVAETQRFCERCGTALEAGRCPFHGFEVSTNGSTTARLGRPAPPIPFAVPTRPSPVTPPPIHNTPWATEPSESRWQPNAPARQETRTTADSGKSRSGRSGPGWMGVVALILAVLFGVALIVDHVHLQHAADVNRQALSRTDQRLADQLTATNALASKVNGLASDPTAVARVRASVFTIDTPDGLGSGWVVASAGGSSTIVTDYHVVQSVWVASGAHTVQVKQDAKNLTGTITKVDQGDDLAVITVKEALTPLPRSTSDAMVGDPVLVVGSPLGLSGTVASGIVSSFRNGLLQFSAPISPGDSGGPVVNRQGQVIGVAESKLVGSGVEGLSFAIPITTVCSTVTSC